MKRDEVVVYSEKEFQKICREIESLLASVEDPAILHSKKQRSKILVEAAWLHRLEPQTA